MKPPTPGRRNTTRRGLGYAHREQVARLHTAHVDGTPCWWCGLPMFRDRTKNPDYDPDAIRSDGKPDTRSGVLAGDHSNPRSAGGTRADRLLHGLCNTQRGDGSRDDNRPALRSTAAPQSALGDLVMGWPVMP
ncbi:MAG: hypothetical protein WBB00_07445 [Mycobacterium sp.]